MKFLERYEVIPDAEVFFGGQAKVYQCLDSYLGGNVAVKVTNLSTSLMARTHERDVKSLKRLSHDNIIELLDWGAENNQGIVVLPLLPNNLRNHLSSNTDMKNSEKMRQIIVPLASALAYSHENNVFHRDIKPTNVLMNSFAVPLLSDFGSAKLFGQGESELTQLAWKSPSYTPESLGTPSQHDVYSFGIMAIEVITGVMPKDRIEAIELLESKNLRGGTHFSPETRDLIMKCIELDPKNRFSSAIEMYSRLVERENARKISENDRQFYAWIRMDDRVRDHLHPLKKDFDNLNLAINAQFATGQELFAYPSKNENDGTFKMNEFWFITDRLKLKLKQNTQKDGWYATEGQLRDSQDLEYMRSHGFSLSSLGVQWGVHKSDPSPGKSKSGFGFVSDALSGWLNKGAPIERGTMHVNQDIDGLTSSWSKILDAREEVATVNYKPLRYKNARIEGLRINLILEDVPANEEVEGNRDFDLEGSYWKVNFSRPEVAEVVMHLGNELELLLGREPNGRLKPTGQLTPEVERGLASQLRRQRDAINALNSRSSVNPKLGDFLANLTQISDDAPVSVTGWKDESLDDSKKAAVAKALGTKDFLLVKGPPGTGKTSFIAEYVHQEVKRNPTIQILLVSQTHVALDNALEKLTKNGMSDCVRLGLADDKRIAEDSKKLLIDVQMREWMHKLRKDSDGFIEDEALKAGVGVQEARALLTVRELQVVQSTIERLQKDIEGEIEEINVGQEAVNEISLSTSEILERKRTEEARLIDLLGRQLAGKLTIPRESKDLDVSHIEGAILGPQKLSAEFMKIVDTQAKWLDRVGSSSQLTPVFLKTRRLLAGTCIGFMSLPEVRDLKFDICIIDEASRATIPQGLVSMVKAEKWIVVGDSNQLAPSEVELRNYEAREILEKYEIELADTEESIFGFLEDSLPPAKQMTLKTQYRMRNEIGQMVSTLFYHNEIESDGPQIDSQQSQYFRAVEWSDTSNLVFSQKQEFRDRLSFTNRTELQEIKRSLDALKNSIDRGFIKLEQLPLKKGERLKVLIIAPYAAQVIQARTMIGNTSIYPFDVSFNSVDAVQGRESDIVYFSCVRMNERQEVGFMGPKNWRRINVALSRARLQLHIVGDAEFWQNTKSDLRDVVQYIREQDSDQFLMRDLAND
jgi:serine/threonine protein kinase